MRQLQSALRRGPKGRQDLFDEVPHGLAPEDDKALSSAQSDR
jgi:hypothetical protein